MFSRLPLNIQDQGHWKLIRVLKKRDQIFKRGRRPGIRLRKNLLCEAGQGDRQASYLHEMTGGYHNAFPYSDMRDKVYHPTAMKSITAFIDFLGRKKYLLGGFRNPIRSDKTPAKEE
jgi:hypothetical protein